MKWMDVVMGEVQAKRDDAQSREARRREVAQATQSALDSLVRPALQAAAQRLEADGGAPRLTEYAADEHAGQRLRLAVGEAGEEAFIEFAAEPFHRLIMVWLCRRKDRRAHRFAVLGLDDLDGTRIDDCLQAFERAGG